MCYAPLSEEHETMVFPRTWLLQTVSHSNKLPRYRELGPCFSFVCVFRVFYGSRGDELVTRAAISIAGRRRSILGSLLAETAKKASLSSSLAQ